MKTHHYNVGDNNFGGEDWYNFTTGSYFDNSIYYASFITNCRGYQQLVEFKSNNVVDFKSKNAVNYIHFYSGFEQLLLIEVKK